MQVPAPSHCVLLVQRDNDQFEGSIIELSYPMNQMPVKSQLSSSRPDNTGMHWLQNFYVDDDGLETKKQ